MSLTEHEAAVELTLALNQDRLNLFEEIGNRGNITTETMQAYILAVQSLRGRLSIANAQYIISIFDQLSLRLEAEAERLLVRSSEIGLQAGYDLLDVYGVSVDDLSTREKQKITEDSLAAFLGVTSAQINRAKLLALTPDPDENLILGDYSRVGLLTPSIATAELDTQAQLVISLIIAYLLERSTAGQSRLDPDRYVLQAIASVDHRTTRTCLLVHGQTRELRGGYFVLTGTPRYANNMKYPQFHRYCRTSTALVRAADANDELTQQMIASAEAELDTHNRTPLTPANAFTIRT
ncbi:MAG: hypothetical protein JRE40_00095 [Deltaproteobacteria bacterium]|nr:hypothetical protein [Deltaproteobacteria bacterium]